MVSYRTRDGVSFTTEGDPLEAKIYSVGNKPVNILLTGHDALIVNMLLAKANESIGSTPNTFVPKLYLAIRNATVRGFMKSQNVIIKAETDGYISELGLNILPDSVAVRSFDFHKNPVGLDGVMDLTFVGRDNLRLLLFGNGKNYRLLDNGLDVTSGLHHHVKQSLFDLHKLFRDDYVRSAVRPHSELVYRLKFLEDEYGSDRKFHEGEKAYYLGKIKAVKDLLGINYATTKEKGKKKVVNS